MEFIVTQMHPSNGKRSQVCPQPTCPNPCPCPSVHVSVPTHPEVLTVVELYCCSVQRIGNHWTWNSSRSSSHTRSESPISLRVWVFALPIVAPCHRILAEGKWETVFLLSGDDLKVHLYREEWRLSEVCVYRGENTILTVTPSFCM